MSESAARVPFVGWAPVPHRVFRDYVEGRSSFAEWHVETALYMLGNRSGWIVKASSLADLASRIGWEQTLDYLSKVLRKLRERGSIAYEASPVRVRHAYVITLRYPGSVSEERPSTETGGPPPVWWTRFD